MRDTVNDLKEVRAIFGNSNPIKPRQYYGHAAHFVRSSLGTVDVRNAIEIRSAVQSGRGLPDSPLDVLAKFAD